MRVAVVSRYFPNSHHPWAGHSAYQTLRVLARKCDLKVFCPGATYPRVLTPPAARKAQVDPTWRPGEVDVEYISYPTLPLVARPLNGFSIAHRLLRHVRPYNPDIILNYVVYPDGYAAVRIGRALRVPVVITSIGSDINRIADPLCRVLTKAALRKADFVTTVSADLSRKAILLGAHAHTTRPKLNGCDTSIFFPADRAAAREALGISPEAEVLLYVGRLDVDKGLIELIEATAELHKCRPNLHCYVVGDGPDRGVILEALQRTQSESFITLVPPCRTEGVAQWMAACDVVTLPSYREGCPNVVVEALAAGRPVVASDVGGIPELMDDAVGRLVPARQVAPLVTAFDDVLSQSWDAEWISSQRSRSWADVAHDLFEILQGTLQQYGARDAAPVRQRTTV